MALSITSEYSNPQYAVMQKFQSTYKQSDVSEKISVEKANSTPRDNIANLREISGNDILEYLSVDEKRILKEVFGDFNLDKNTSSSYYGTKYSDFMKGSQIDVRL